MIAPMMQRGLRLTLVGEPASEPYMAIDSRHDAPVGASVDRQGAVIEVAPGAYRTPDGFEVEADWSAASYWYEIEALTSGWLTLRGLDATRRQSAGAIRDVPDYSPILGVETEPEGENGGIDLVASPDVAPRFVADMADTPDIVQTVAVSCAMLGVPFRLTGVASLRIKETDRIEALRRELLKVGVIMQTEGDDCIFWESTLASGDRNPGVRYLRRPSYGHGIRSRGNLYPRSRRARCRGGGQVLSRILGRSSCRRVYGRRVFRGD